MNRMRKIETGLVLEGKRMKKEGLGFENIPKPTKRKGLVPRGSKLKKRA